MFKPTPTDPLTEEDKAIILRNPALDSVVGMLVGDKADYRIMFQFEVDKFWAKRQQWELDYVY